MCCAASRGHHETGEPLPDDLLDAMVRAKNLSSGIANLRQMFFARLDFALHSPGFDGDTTRAVRELYPITGFPYPEGTHFQAGFGHLFGYDAGYYGYLWSRVFGDDMFTRFEAAGVLDRATGPRLPAHHPRARRQRRRRRARARLPRPRAEQRRVPARPRPRSLTTD